VLAVGHAHAERVDVVAVGVIRLFAVRGIDEGDGTGLRVDVEERRIGAAGLGEGERVAVGAWLALPDEPCS